MLSLSLDESLAQNILKTHEEELELNGVQEEFLAGLQWELEIELEPIAKEADPVDAVKKYQTQPALNALCLVIEASAQQFKTLYLKNIPDEVQSAIIHILQAQAKNTVKLETVVTIAVQNDTETCHYFKPVYRKAIAKENIYVAQPLMVRTESDSSLHSQESAASANSSQNNMNWNVSPEDAELSDSFLEWPKSPKSPMSTSESNLEKLKLSCPNLKLADELAKVSAYSLFRQQLHTQVNKEKQYNAQLSPGQHRLTRSCTDAFFKPASPRKNKSQIKVKAKEYSQSAQFQQPSGMNQK